MHVLHHTKLDSAEYIKWRAHYKGSLFLKTSPDSIIYEKATARVERSENDVRFINISSVELYYATKKETKQEYFQLADQLEALFPSLNRKHFRRLRMSKFGRRKDHGKALKFNSTFYTITPDKDEDIIVSICINDRTKNKYFVEIGSINGHSETTPK